MTHGETRLYTLLDLLGGADQTIVNVSLCWQGSEVREFGHVDHVTANDAAQDVWWHLLAWIEVH